MVPLLSAVLLASRRFPPPLVLRAATLTMLLVLSSLGGAPHPAEPLRTLRVPSVMLFPAVGTLGCGGLIGLVPTKTVLRRVGPAAHPAPDSVLASYLQVVKPLALVAPDRLALVGTQGIRAPAAQVQLGGGRPL